MVREECSRRLGITRLIRLIGLLSFCLMTFGCSPSSPTQFALIGDGPYGAVNLPKYERLIEDINGREGIAWVVHLGDMKDSLSSCSDEDLKRIYELNQRFVAPFILTPGDNDWFDCRREMAGGWDRQGRLNKLREIFYDEPSALPLVSQGGSGVFGDGASLHMAAAAMGEAAACRARVPTENVKQKMQAATTLFEHTIQKNTAGVELRWRS